MNKQIKRVIILTDMLEDLLSMKLNYQESIKLDKVLTY